MDHFSFEGWKCVFLNQISFKHTCTKPKIHAYVQGAERMHIIRRINIVHTNVSALVPVLTNPHSPQRSNGPSLKPWSNGPARHTAQVGASWTCAETCVGWSNGQASFLTSTRESQKTHFKADMSCISLANNPLMNVTQLALTWVGWPNGEKLAVTCLQIWCWPKWAQVSASQRKPWPNRVASRTKFSTCVYLRLRLARA